MSFCDAPFWLDVTLCCGQVFRWDKRGNWWYGVAREKVLKVRQVGNKFEYANVDAEFVEHYFSLDMDLQKIVNSVNKDAHIGKALKEYFGLRLISRILGMPNVVHLRNLQEYSSHSAHAQQHGTKIRRKN